MSQVRLSDTEIRMSKVPGGEVELRDDRIKAKWKVDIKPFLLSEYPVTQDLYYAVTNESPSIFKGNKHPVENVSWVDAINFCNELSMKSGLKSCYSIINGGGEIRFIPESNGYRLPSEAEWEYACRAGTNKVIYGEIDRIAWYAGNSEGKPHDVGNKEPNEWGLYDMLGNVWEWCWDIYDEEVYGSYRIFRGGGWNDPERGCLASNRRRSHPSFRIDDLGFRLAKSI